MGLERLRRGSKSTRYGSSVNSDPVQRQFTRGGPISKSFEPGEEEAGEWVLDRWSRAGSDRIWRMVG